jgi:hypothetical protein
LILAIDEVINTTKSIRPTQQARQQPTSMASSLRQLPKNGNKKIKLSLPFCGGERQVMLDILLRENKVEWAKHLILYSKYQANEMCQWVNAFALWCDDEGNFEPMQSLLGALYPAKKTKDLTYEEARRTLRDVVVYDVIRESLISITGAEANPGGGAFFQRGS